MRSPFPSAAQAYAESIDSDTASRHHPDARLTILPLPSLAALYPLEDNHASSGLPDNTSASTHHNETTADSSHRNLQVRLLHGNHQQNNPHLQQQRHQPIYQSYDNRFQKFPVPASSPLPNVKPSLAQQNPIRSSNKPEEESHFLTSPKAACPDYIGTSMESLLNAIEVHPALSASSPSRSPSPSSNGYTHSASSAPTSPLSSPRISTNDSHTNHISATNKARMSISHLLDDTPEDKHSKQKEQPQLQQRKQKSNSPKSSSPTFSTIDITKRKWSNLSSANFEEERNAKIRRSIQAHVSGHASESQSAPESSLNIATVFPRQVFDTKNPSTRYQMTTICCLHASVAQKSYGSEKRFLCPPPIVNIQAPQGDSKSALSSRPQVTMSVVCETSDGNNSLGQRSTLEDDHTGTFRYLYVTGSAKAKSFQLKLQVYGRACLPNGFISNESTHPDSEEGVFNTADLPEPYAVFDSAPIAIISKPSKKTAKARNVSSCILTGSLVSLFNRINSQTVRTKYMSVQDGEFCAKNSTWSSFSVTIVSNGPSNSARIGSPKSHHRQPAIQSSSPITYGAEIVLTETATGVQSDRLIVCKVENGRIQENATGPICQMQKVALMSTERNEDGEPVYLSAVGNDHQVGRYMDHSSASKTVLKYQPSTMASGNTDIMKPGSDDFLCWTIVGISKFEYTYFESLPADSEAHHPITPFPTLMRNPIYNAASHTLELVVSNFYSQIGSQTSQVPMHVWLGSRGPLTTHIIRRSVSNSVEPGCNGNVDQTTLLVDLPQGRYMGVAPDEKTLSLPLLFVRHSDGITYNSRATVVFTRPENGEGWTVSIV
ncbi:hypothetical protein BGZ80_009635 [Entomortierella chlamydospora]|uniref:Uncharacterized protein n=1 Tax=Entomortierella chlamydospora TaxID=101097 RepID=A0A9P6MWX2_9FUNG|nr:hypothetical protein BGZ79_009490 [Entomortierella chlamydospora]KAG0015784.1 hypothetical protein BGZ80_009635 [Entomortierella chlamydospora]